MKVYLFMVGILLGVGVYAVASEKAEKIVAGTALNSWVQGNIESSDHVMDTAISGNGFFILQNQSGKVFYTRVLNMRLDLDGNLIHNLSGYKLLSLNESGKLGPINLNTIGTKLFEKKEGCLASLTAVNITDAGVIEGLYSDGSSVQIAQIHLAIFQNQRRLKLSDKSKHLLTANKFTGEVAYVSPAIYGAGLLSPRSNENIDDLYYLRNLDK